MARWEVGVGEQWERDGEIRVGGGELEWEEKMEEGGGGEEWEERREGVGEWGVMSGCGGGEGKVKVEEAGLPSKPAEEQ